MELTLAIDLGTTNLKVGVINERGKILSSISSGIKTISEQEGEAVHDPEEIKKIIAGLCARTMEGCNKNDVKYIVSSTYHLGLMMLDEHRKPLTGITLLTDTRSQSTFSDFLASFSDSQLYRKTGCPLISQYLLPRLFYFLKSQNELFKKTKYFHDSKSFLFEWLTGEWLTDISTATATQLFNIQQLQWDEEILSKVNLSAKQFPPVADGTKLLAPVRKEIAELLGLQENVQVVLGVYDGAVLGICLSGLSPDVGIMNVGTTAMLRLPGFSPVYDKSENRRIQAYAFDKKIFLNGGALNNAALPLNWLRNNLFDFNLQDERLLNISNAPPLISLPYLTGERDSKIGPFSSGVFFGVRPHHTKLDFVRSVLEGVAYSMRYILDALQENEIPVNEIRMGGGGVHIKAWPQLFADILGVPVSIPQLEEAALFGNAMLAFTSTGFYKNFKEASDNMPIAKILIAPREEFTSTREKHYLFYKKLREELGPLYKEHLGLHK